MVDRSTLSPDYQRDWPAYFDAVADKPPRDTLLRALDLFDAEGRAESRGRVAIDVACGSGRDTRAILSRAGWSVVAVDSHAEAIRRTEAGLGAGDGGRCMVVRAEMEELAGMRGLPASADLINASFALPFCRPEAFPALWAWLLRTLAPGGRFAGQFFGDRDEWACVRPKSHRTRAEVDELLGALRVEHLEEVDREGDDATGKIKRHHVFHVVARKPA